MKITKRRGVIHAITLSGFTLVTANAHAEVLWHDFSATYLKGNNYRLGNPHQQVFTLEHVAGTSWGDSFFFLDHMREASGERSNYAEWSPRLSLSKVAARSLQYGLINDVLISTTVEMSEFQTNFLYGLGIDLNVVGFQFLQLNAYRRNNDHAADNWQLTSAWAVPFELAKQPFLFDGFFDWTNTTSEQRASLGMSAQLKWGIHPLLGVKNPIYLGVEYVYWHNKFGIANSAMLRTHESNMNLLLKAHF